jgi:REP element-mobilizing transposase RayT
MPRVARQLVDGGIYHLINRGNAQQTVFKKEQDFQAFTDLFLQMCNDFNIDLYAWCLMTNHYHLVVRPHKAELLSKGIHWFSQPTCADIIATMAVVDIYGRDVTKVFQLTTAINF